MTARTVTRGFAEASAVVFLFVTAYALATKLPEGRLTGDWMHSVLGSSHLSGVVLPALDC